MFRILKSFSIRINILYTIIVLNQYTKEDFVKKYDVSYYEEYSKPEIYQRLKETRKELGLTQEELAELFHTRQTTYSKMENGKLKLNYLFLKLFCVEFNINLN